MHRLLFVAIAFVCQIAACGPFPKPQETPPKPRDEHLLSIQGIITDAAGLPLKGISVELVPKSSSSAVSKTVSANDGSYAFSSIGPTGAFYVVFSGVGCNTVVRQFPNPEALTAPITLNIQIQCCGPSVPDKPHKRSPPLPFEHYLGTYAVQMACSGKLPSEYLIEFTDKTGTGHGRCLCTKDRKFAIVSSKGCPVTYACWQVKSDGDVEVNFACEGISFAGNAWTLWEEGGSLAGQSHGWTDCGCPPPKCDLRLAPIKH
jgi:hypothetical protein